MKHVIIGTAGHVDHGKTTLIKALTKIETDRLKEEKERGISIEVGFAYFDLPSGRRAGVIDVPGHERFIKNMLAGISGVDLVVLVIAADEGVMPQTQEHLNIVSLLQVKRGLVALTKKDMVDEEWLELIQEQVRESIQGTFLAEAPIIPVSSISGEGLDILVSAIDNMTSEVVAKDTQAMPRLSIDRAFTVTGHGTVVTGTLTEGTIRVSDRLELLPSKLETKVRSIQVHGKKEEVAYAGQRTAINLAGIDLENVTRGDVLAAIGRLTPSMMFDARLQMVKDSPKPLKNRARVRLYLGTTEILGRVVILNKEELEPGESGLVQLRLEEPVAVAKSDLFIIRSYSPMITIGGGTIIDPNPSKKGRFKDNVIASLELLEKGSPEEITAQALYKASPQFPLYLDFVRSIHLPNAEEIADTLIEQELAILVRAEQKEYLIHGKYLDEVRSQLESLLENFHKANPLKPGMLKEELRSRLLRSANSKLFGHLLLMWESDGIISQDSAHVTLAGFEINLNPKQQQLKHNIQSLYLQGAFAPPTASEINLKFPNQDVQLMLEMLLREGSLVKLAEDILIHRQHLDEAEGKLRSFITAHGSITLADLRDLLSTSRKYALPLIEFFDQQKITIRQGEKRVLRVR